jgi:hypothetical protein
MPDAKASQIASLLSPFLTKDLSSQPMYFSVSADAREELDSVAIGYSAKKEQTMRFMKGKYPKHKAGSSRFNRYNKLKKPKRVRRSRNKYTPHIGKKQQEKGLRQQEKVLLQQGST